MHTHINAKHRLLNSLMAAGILASLSAPATALADNTGTILITFYDANNTALQTINIPNIGNYGCRDLSAPASTTHFSILNGTLGALAYAEGSDFGSCTYNLQEVNVPALGYNASIKLDPHTNPDPTADLLASAHITMKLTDIASREDLGGY